MHAPCMTFNDWSIYHRIRLDRNYQLVKFEIALIEERVIDTFAEKNISFKLPQKSNKHWCRKNEHHLNIDYNERLVDTMISSF
jgi:hypothetical protein